MSPLHVGTSNGEGVDPSFQEPVIEWQAAQEPRDLLIDERTT